MRGESIKRVVFRGGEEMAESDKVPLLERSRTFGKNESPWISVFNMCNVAIGAGVLSIPYGFRQTGVLGGLFFTSLIWVIEVFTLCLLIRVAEKHGCQSYQRLVSTLLGPHMAVVTSVVVLTLCIGAMVSYFIIAGDVFTPIFAEAVGKNSIFSNRKFVIISLGILVILPLSLKTTLKSLKYTSVLSVIVLSYLTMALIFIGVAQMIKEGFPTDVLVFEAGMGAFITLDIVVFAFLTHVQVVSIFAELAEHPNPFFLLSKDPLQGQVLDEEVISDILVEGYRSERVKRMDGIICLSMSICFILYSLVGELGYLIFRDVEGDILKSFGNKNVMMNFARVGMAVVAMVCYPVQHHPTRSIVDDAIKHVAKLPASNFSWTRHVLITLSFFIFTLGIALSVTDLGKVFSIIGSTGGVMVVFIIPGSLLLLGSHHGSVASTDIPMRMEGEAKALRPRNRSQACMEVFGGTCIVIFGLTMFFATDYVTLTG